MRLPPFALERYFARYEFQVPYLLSSSDVEALSMAELLELADAEGRERWEGLSLGYTTNGFDRHEVRQPKRGAALGSLAGLCRKA